MMFDARYSNQSKKFLKKADKILTQRLLEKIEKLQEKPIIHDTKVIEGSKNLFRVRVDDYRILYEIDYQNKLIGIIKIDKREKVYD